MAINRREFMQASAAAYILSHAARMRAQTAPAYVNRVSDQTNGPSAMAWWSAASSLIPGWIVHAFMEISVDGDRFHQAHTA